MDDEPSTESVGLGSVPQTMLGIYLRTSHTSSSCDTNATATKGHQHTNAHENKTFSRKWSKSFMHTNKPRVDGGKDSSSATQNSNQSERKGDVAMFNDRAINLSLYA